MKKILIFFLTLQTVMIFCQSFAVTDHGGWISSITGYRIFENYAEIDYDTDEILIRRKIKTKITIDFHASWDGYASIPYVGRGEVRVFKDGYAPVTYNFSYAIQSGPNTNLYNSSGTNILSLNRENNETYVWIDSHYHRRTFRFHSTY